MSKAKVKKRGKGARYFTWAHNIEMCLQNGSFVRQGDGGPIHQYMNGDYMGIIDAIPEKMTEVPADQARELIPQCCK